MALGVIQAAFRADKRRKNRRKIVIVNNKASARNNIGCALILLGPLVVIGLVTLILSVAFPRPHSEAPSSSSVSAPPAWIPDPIADDTKSAYVRDKCTKQLENEAASSQRTSDKALAPPFLLLSIEYEGSVKRVEMLRKVIVWETNLTYKTKSLVTGKEETTTDYYCRYRELQDDASMIRH